jgi:histidinol-phosphate aminotransferase
MSVNTIGLHGAIAALRVKDLEARECARNAEARAFTVKRLEALGAKVPVSHANFVMADIGRDTVAFAAECLARGVAVGRPFPPLSTHSRISIGTAKDMQFACYVFEQVLKS